jgi:hypothetical protein
MMISWFPCVKNKKNPKADLRMAKIYWNAKKRYFMEMDVLNIVRTTRMMRMWMQIMLNRRQRILLNY